MSVIFQSPEGNNGDGRLDDSVYATEYKIADRAESLGFDSLWSVEHHLNGYAMCPDPLKFLTYFAGRTQRIRLGTMVVVLPWHDAVRVCEDVSVLDHISGGRHILGVGRGVAKIEFDAFKVDMNDSRDLLIDNIRAIQMGLEQGYIELEGKVVKQPLAHIRPRPNRSFRHRIYGSAQSPETYPLFGELGIGLLFVPGQKSWAVVAAELDIYRNAFRAHHGRQAPAPIFAGWVFVDEDEGRAQELGRTFLGKYITSARDHYNVQGDHMKNLKSYESYVQSINVAKAAGVTDTDIVNNFVENHIYGTPNQCVDRIRNTREKLGAAGFIGVFNYSGMGEAEALRNQSLFAAKVLPRLKELEPDLDIGVDGPTGQVPCKQGG